MGGLILWIYRVFSKRKWLLLLLVGCWAVVVVAGLFRLQFSEDITDMLPADEDGRTSVSTLNTSRFTDRVVFHLYADSGATDVDIIESGDFLVAALDSLQPELLEAGNLKIEAPDIGALYNLVLQQLPYLLNDADYAYLDSLNNEELVKQIAGRNFKNIISPTGILSSKFVVNDPLGLGGRVLKRLDSFNLDQNLELTDGFLVTPDEQHLILFAHPSFEANNSALNTRLYDATAKIAEAINQEFGGTVTLEAVGAPFSASVNASQIKEDIMLTVSLAFVTLMVVIFIFYRSFRIFLFILIPSAIGGATTLAIFAWWGVEVSLIAVSIGSILLGISIDFALHVFTHFRSNGDIHGTLKDIAEPALLSAATTAAAFYTLLLLDAPAMQQLGVFAATSVLFGSLTALILLPHVLTIKMRLPEEKQNTFIDKLNRLRPDKNKLVVGGVLLITIFFLIRSGNVGFEGDLLKMNYTTPELQRAETNLNEISNVSLKQVMLLTEGNNWEQALEKSDSLNRMIDRELSAGKVSERASVNTILPTPSEAERRIARWNKWVSAGNLDTVAQQLAAYSEELGLTPDAYNPFFAQATSAYPPMQYELWQQTPLFSNFIQSDSNTVQILTAVKLEQQHRPEFTENASRMPGVEVLDKQFITNQIIGAVQQDFDQLVKVSLLIVFLILLLVYGRIELAVYTFIPMLLAWVWTLGIMNLLGLKFNIFNIIVSSFIFGLGIDYSVFISRSMLQKFKFGTDELVAYKNSIFLSAFTTTVGVGVLILADHPALQSIAAMSVIGIGSMLLLTYTIQPLLYRVTMIRRKERGLVPINFLNLFYGILSLLYFFVGCIILNVALLLLQLVPVSGVKKRSVFRHLMSFYLSTIVVLAVNVRRRFLNPHDEQFKEPAVIIANHQSFIDILLLLHLQPNVVMVVKKWVYTSPLFGWPVRYAGYFHVNDGYEQALPKLRKLVDQGCSIIIFPEGTRTTNGELNRFHKGAFFLSEALKLDIVPVLFHGSDYAMPKGDSFLLKNGFVHRVVLPRIKYNDRSFGDSYQERTKGISRWYKKEFQQYRKEFETPGYFRDLLLRNYVMKGPVLYWYARIKTSLENNYTEYEKLLPKSGKVIDIGCGYGFMAHILAWTSGEREVIGIDHDEDKIRVAQQTPTITPNLRFEVRNALEYELPVADVFTLMDVLHYLPETAQRTLILKCLNSLSDGGLLMIRDADAELQDRQKGTWLTEFFSTRFGFNKTNSNQLTFTGRKFITSVAGEAGADVEVIDNGKFTSNVLYLIRKPNGAN